MAAPIYEEMKRLDAAFATHTELSKALSNPALSAADKVRVLSSAFGEKPDDYLLRFVQLVIRNRRETFARAIALAYQDIYRRANHIARVTIITAVALDKEVLDRIGDLMKKQTDKTLEFVYEIDPSIIGGFILRVDSMQLDARGDETDGERWRIFDGIAYYRDTGRRRFGLYPYERDFDYRRTDILGNGIV